MPVEGGTSRSEAIRHPPKIQVTVASNKGNPAKDLLVEAGDFLQAILWKQEQQNANIEESLEVESQLPPGNSTIAVEDGHLGVIYLFDTVILPIQNSDFTYQAWPKKVITPEGLPRCRPLKRGSPNPWVHHHVFQ